MDRFLQTKDEESSSEGQSIDDSLGANYVQGARRHERNKYFFTDLDRLCDNVLKEYIIE